MDGRIKNTVRNSVSGFINKFCMLFFPFAIRTLTIRYMGAEYLGLNSLFTSVLQVLSLTELGLSNAVVFSLYKPIAEGDKKLIGAIYNFLRKIYRVIGIIILVVGVLITPVLPKLISGDVPTDINIYILYYIYLFNTAISYFLFAYKECLLTAHQRSDISSNISTFTYTGMYLLQCVVIVLFQNYYIYILFLPLCTIVINIMRSVQVDKMFPDIVCEGKLDKDNIDALKKRIGGLVLYKISGVCRNSFDSIVLSAFLGLIVLAKYQNYFYIMNSVGNMIAIVTTAATASIGNSIATESIEKNYINFNVFSALYNWVSGWCTVCLLCLYQPFMNLWLGKDYLFSFDIVVLLCIYFYVCKISDILYTYRQAAGLWWEDKFRPIVESVVNLVLNILVVKNFGVCGVIISTIVTIAFINIPWGAYILFKYYFREEIIPFLKDTLKYIVELMVVCIITYSICTLITGQSILSFLVKLVICCVIANILFFLIFRKSKYYQRGMQFIRKIFSR